mgnify:CR=1 FL=1
MKNRQLIIYFILACLSQVLLFNEFLFSGYLNPYVYLFFLILLPPRLSRTSILLISFLTGLCIDVFENSAGVHAAACTAYAFIRPLLLRLLIKKSQDETRESLNFGEAGFISLSLYCLASVFAHHFILFTIEAFSFKNISVLLTRTLYSSLFTFGIILLLLLWNIKKRPTV